MKTAKSKYVKKWKWLHSTADIFLYGKTAHAYESTDKNNKDILVKIETTGGKVLRQRVIDRDEYFKIFATGIFQENDELTILYRAAALVGYKF